jgi:hypothetical protein
MQKIHTKNTKKEKNTKRNQGVFVRYPIVKLKLSLLTTTLFSFFILCSLFLRVLCVKSSPLLLR